VEGREGVGRGGRRRNETCMVCRALSVYFSPLPNLCVLLLAQTLTYLPPSLPPSLPFSLPPGIDAGRLSKARARLQEVDKELEGIEVEKTEVNILLGRKGGRKGGRAAEEEEEEEEEEEDEEDDIRI